VDVYRSGRTEIIAGWDDRFNREIYERFGHERLLRIFMPIQLRDRVTGVIEVAYDRGSREEISDDQVQLLGAFVDQAAVALENAHLLSQTQRALEETETLYTASQRLAVASQAQEMVAAVAESVRIDTVDRVVLWSVERDDRDQVEGFVSVANWHRGDGPRPLAVGTRFPLAAFPAGRLALGTEALFFENVLVDGRIDEVTRSVFAQQEARSLALLPVRVGQRQLGLLMVVGRDSHAFSVGERRLLTSLAGQMVVGLERLNLLTQAQGRLRHEQVLREVAERVRGSVDVETVMRTAVQEAGRALGRPTFIYLGSEEELHVPQAPKEG
jgi:GAF domain-containing protein